MTKDQENVNLPMKDNALRNEGDSYPMKFVILFEAKDLKELTKKVASIEISGGMTHFQSRQCCLSPLSSEFLRADGRQNSPLVISVGPESFSISHYQTQGSSLIPECNFFFTKIHQTYTKHCLKEINFVTLIKNKFQVNDSHAKSVGTLLPPCIRFTGSNYSTIKS